MNIKIFASFSEQGIGPHLYGFFEGGRVEEFLHARTLTTKELPQYLTKIGEKIANVHHCDIDLDRNPQLFENLYLWLDNARSVTASDPGTQLLLSSFDFAKIEAEVVQLKIRLDKLNSPILFCHNDLIAGNMMFDDDNQELFFIDYEYGCYNYRGFDFGNHFCEWTLDYSVQEYPKFRVVPEAYPSKEYQHQLFKAYVRQWKTFKKSETTTTTTTKPELTEEEEVELLIKEANDFALASHLLWSLWGIIQSASSEIEFGYLEFAQARLGEYYRLKTLLDTQTA